MSDVVLITITFVTVQFLCDTVYNFFYWMDYFWVLSFELKLASNDMYFK